MGVPGRDVRKERDRLGAEVAAAIHVILSGTGMTVSSVAGAMGVSRSYVSAVLNGHKSIGLMFLARVTGATGVRFTIDVEDGDVRIQGGEGEAPRKRGFPVRGCREVRRSRDPRR